MQVPEAACLDRDPVAHTVEAHDRLPGSRLKIFDNAGHFCCASSWTHGPAAEHRQAVRRRILGVAAGPAEPLTSRRYPPVDIRQRRPISDR